MSSTEATGRPLRKRRASLGPKSMKVAVLVGTLALVGLGAHAPKQAEVACTRTRDLVVVDLHDVRHRHIIDHALDARRAGKPRILHIRRDEATANRRASLRDFPTKRGYDRDEYRRP
jgi:hypothetical protein